MPIKDPVKLKESSRAYYLSLKRPVNRTCAVCGTDFVARLVPQQIRQGLGKVCSWECQRKGMSLDLKTGFYDRIEKTSSCWNWLGPRMRSGYGRASFSGRRGLAHRISYELLRAPVPSNLQIDHVCRNRLCVNPDHLCPMTRKENLRRGIGPTGIRHRQIACKYGHPFDEKNTRIRKNGTRQCRRCSVRQVTEYRVRANYGARRRELWKARRDRTASTYRTLR